MNITSITSSDETTYVCDANCRCRGRPARTVQCRTIESDRSRYLRMETVIVTPDLISGDPREGLPRTLMNVNDGVRWSAGSCRRRIDMIVVCLDVDGLIRDGVKSGWKI